MKISRRRFLGGSSAVAISFSLPQISEAGLHGHGAASTSFNGGVTQTNMVTGRSYPLLNIFQTASNWRYLNPPTAAPNVPAQPLTELDPVSGIPTSIVAGTNGVQCSFSLFPTADYSGVYVLDWIGQGTLVVPGNGSNSGFIPNTGYSFSNLTGANGRFEFTLQSDNTPQNISITAITTAFSQIRIYRKIDEALLDAGQIIGVDFHAKMKQANPGTIRSLAILGSIGSNGTNDCTMATWEQRKPRTYFSYSAQQWTAANYAGQATQSGNSFTVSSGSTLSDKLMQHVLIPSPPANSCTGSTLTCAISSASPGVVTLASHGLVNGDIITFGIGGGSVPSPLVAGNYYYALVIDANTFNIAATRGGSAINTIASGTSVQIALWMSLSIDGGSTYYPMTAQYFPYPTSAFTGFGANKPTSGSTITVVFDQATQLFVMSNLGVSNVGLLNGWPPEVFIDLCAAIGSRPHLVSPFLSMETAASVNSVTDFMTSWVSYAKTTYPWMKPIVEPPNETWNFAASFMATYYVGAVAWQRWALSSDNLNQVYGKWTSTLGQAISSIFGNDRTKYSMICSIQSVSMYAGGTGGNDNRFKCAQYVSANGGSAAYNWIDRGCCATYYGPAERYQCQELIDAFNWTVTDNGNSAAQSAIAENYVGTCTAGNTFATLAYNLQIFTNYKTYLQGLPAGNTIAGMVGYEGGYSPDYLTLGDWNTSITGATQANPCVLTLAATTSNGEQSGMSGNPATVGMAVTPSGVGGMTGLNLPSAVNVTFVANSPNITLSSGSISVGQAVCFSSSGININWSTNAAGAQAQMVMPTGIVQCQPYYVVSSAGSVIQVSATKGGTAITPTDTGVGGNGGGSFSFQVRECFVVTAVSGNQVTINYDASAQPAYTSGGTLTYTFSQALSNNLRWAGKSTNELGTVNTSMNSQWYGLTGSGWSMENVSNFEYFGTDNVWDVLDPDIYVPNTPQWNSIVAANA